MTHEYKVNRVLWESLEATLLGHGRRFVKDMAATLQVDEKALLRHVFPTKESFKVAIQDSESSHCMAAQLLSDEVIGRCRRPVQTGTPFCVHHTTHRPLVSPEHTPIRKIQDAPDRPALWLLPDQSVVDSEGVLRGTLVNQRLMLIT